MKSVSIVISTFVLMQLVWIQSCKVQRSQLQEAVGPSQVVHKSESFKIVEVYLNTF